MFDKKQTRGVITATVLERTRQMNSLILLILAAIQLCAGRLNHYVKMAKTDAVGNDLAFFACGEGIE